MDVVGLNHGMTLKKEICFTTKKKENKREIFRDAAGRGAMPLAAAASSHFEC